jgi:hypothetical protein
MFLAIVATTIWRVSSTSCVSRRGGRCFLPAYAAFVGHAVDAAVIDIDH